MKPKVLLPRDTEETETIDTFRPVKIVGVGAVGCRILREIDANPIECSEMIALRLRERDQAAG